MGSYNRDYMRNDDHRYGGGGGPGLSHPRNWSVVIWLIAINVAIHLFQVLTFDSERIGTMSRAELFSGHIYLLFTYQFVHANLTHLLFNMLVLYFWGPQLLRAIGTKQFLALYIGAGFFGGLVQVLYSPNPILGASACVVGVVFGLISLAPRQTVNLLLFFVIPIRTAMWKIGAFIVVIEVAMFLAQEVFDMRFGQNGIANLAHLGGGFFGWFWINYGLPFFNRRAHHQEREERWSQAFGTKRVVEAEVVDGEDPAGAGSKPAKPFVSTEIDAILDKISEQGMQSLTEEEKKLLQKSSEKLSKRIDDR